MTLISRGASQTTWGAAFLSGAAALAAGLLLKRYTRYEVTGRSMEPALLPGDFVIVERVRPGHLPALGAVVLVRDPREPQRVLVKRLARIHSGSVWVLGDNTQASTDSRVFGALPQEAILGHVRWRYVRRGRLTLDRV
jgi:nickel-type superoxide dismutase maturation protease